MTTQPEYTGGSVSYYTVRIDNRRWFRGLWPAHQQDDQGRNVRAAGADGSIRSAAGSPVQGMGGDGVKPFNPRPRDCPVCRNSFVPCKPMQSVCSPKCAVKQVRLKKVEEKDQIKTRREKLETLGEKKAKAQAATNAYVLARDADRGCISCGKSNANVWHAGHYRSRGSAPHLALDLRNIWKQCAPCNLYLHGNLIEYRKQLVREHGEAWVLELEADQEPRRLKADELDALTKERRAMTREMKK